MSEPLARLIVLEATPQLAPLLRRFLPRKKICEARSVALLKDMLVESPASFVICTTTAEAAPALLPVIANGVRRYSTSAWIVYGDEGLRRWEEFLLAAGAQRVITSITQLPALKHIIRQHLRRIKEPALPLIESIHARLPWPPK